MFALDGNVAFAFGAGMLATINPCGFVMLPTYLLYFLGMEGATPSGQRASLRRALFVSAAVTAGFFLVFLTIGLVTRWGFTWIRDSASAWLSIIVGAAPRRARHRHPVRRSTPDRHAAGRRRRARHVRALDVPVRHLVRRRVDRLHAADVHRCGARPGEADGVLQRRDRASPPTASAWASCSPLSP